jgi:hypothetical protein
MADDRTRNQQGSTPVPDPTVLTTQALYREIGSLRELLEQDIVRLEQRMLDLISAEHQLREARREDDLRAIDKAEQSVLKRLADMNDLRDEFTRQSTGFVATETFRSERDKMDTLIERNRQEIERIRRESLPRETFDAALAEWTRWRSIVDNYMSAELGHGAGVKATFGGMAALIGGAATVITIVVVLANVMTN